MSSADPSQIPPIEIGALDAFHPQNSEFIGSSSGVFFVNTVFRAFARLGPSTAADGGRENTSPETPSAHDFVGTTEEEESTQTPQARSSQAAEGDESRLDQRDGPFYKHIYSINVPGIGDLPDPELASNLLMLYFKHWHPFYPFLHGPTFFDGLGSLYEDSGKGVPLHDKSRRHRLCQAVTYQCVFNIAATAYPTGLPNSSRIVSSLALLDIVGSVSASHDLVSLQALLSVELYLITTMSLRAASTVHGIITRLIYQSGLHRCPFRYIKLPQDVCHLRKRVLWSAYTLDRYLSQSLGHPLGLQDIDVCVPGANELHEPVVAPGDHKHHSQVSAENVQDHMPHLHRRQSSISTDESILRTSQRQHSDISRTAGSNSEVSNHDSRNDLRSATHIQEHYATYSQLLSEVYELFHISIHSRYITGEKITELLCKINSWWNGLPTMFQGGSDDDDRGSGSNATYVAFFTISYHYLLTLANRPFLSLKTATIEFRANLQRAIGASRGVISQLRHVPSDPFLMACPAMLSAAWMSGLVLAFATLLDMYPFSKSSVEIARSLDILEAMGQKWSSAKHCRHALDSLFRRLKVQSAAGGFSNLLISRSNERLQPGRLDSPISNAPVLENAVSTKRKRADDDNSAESNMRDMAATADDLLREDIGTRPSWTPVMQYNGPDYGFDALRFVHQQGMDQLAIMPDLTDTGIFNDMGWVGFDYGFGGI